MRIKICSFNESVCIDAPENVCNFIKESDFLAGYIPMAHMSTEQGCDTVDIWVESGNEFQFYDSHVIVTSSDESIYSVIVIAGNILERKRQEKRLYQVHGSAVKIEYKSVTIIGGMSGIGKTTLALNLSGYPESSFIGDEKFVIDGVSHNILGGCTLSAHNLKTNVIDTNNIIYEDKPTKLGLVIFPIITNEPKLTAHKLTPLKLFWHLYEEASRDIKGLNFLLNNFSEPHDGFDTDVIMRQRFDDCRAIASSTPGYFLRGNLENVSDFIYNFMTSST
jgi:hypothetical protein